jgi:hypothetical protein
MGVIDEKGGKRVPEEGQRKMGVEKEIGWSQRGEEKEG